MAKLLIELACLLVILGTLFIIWSFYKPSGEHSKKRLIQIGGTGVIIALIGGLLLICFFYANQPVPERIIEEHLEENYPNKPLDVSMR